MHPADIICALSKAGYNQSQIARELNLEAPSSVNLVIHGHRRSFNVASKISAVTGIPLNALWPDGRYATPPEREAA